MKRVGGGRMAEGGQREAELKAGRSGEQTQTLSQHRLLRRRSPRHAPHADGTSLCCIRLPGITTHTLAMLLKTKVCIVAVHNKSRDSMPCRAPRRSRLPASFGGMWCAVVATT